MSAKDDLLPGWLDGPAADRGARFYLHGGKPRRQVVWTRYSAGDLKGTELARRSPDHSPAPDQEIPA
jgi:hypothetical protein